MAKKKGMIDLKALMESNAMKRTENINLKGTIVASTTAVVTNLDERLKSENKQIKAEKKKAREEKHKKQDMFFYNRMENLGVKVIPEYKFHQHRGWRIDFYLEYEETKVALEIEGGVFQRNADGSLGGRHNKATGYLQDMEKYNELTMNGIYLYRVIRDEVARKDYYTAMALLETNSDSYIQYVTRGLNSEKTFSDILKLIGYAGKRNRGTLFG